MSFKRWGLAALLLSLLWPSGPALATEPAEPVYATASEVRQHIHTNTDPNARNPEGLPALHLAIYQSLNENTQQLLQLLLAAGADPFLGTACHLSPIDIALAEVTDSGDTGLLKILLQGRRQHE